MINEKLARLFDKAIEIKSKQELISLEQSCRLQKVFSTNPYQKRHGLYLPKIYYYIDVVTGLIYKFYPQKESSVYGKLGTKKVTIEKIIESLSVNFNLLFKSIENNSDEKEIDRCVTKTLYPQEQLEKFLIKSISDKEELDSRIMTYIKETLNRSLEQFSIQDKKQLILRALSVPQMSTKATNIRLKTCLEDILQESETADEAII